MSAFEPYIYVEHSLRRPTSITAAAFTGAGWRFVEIPEAVLQRPVTEQNGWVGWRVRRHFKQNDGRCLLFGSIIGYRWQRARDEAILLDRRGRITATAHESFTPPTGSIAVGNKILKVWHPGVWQVNL